MRRRLWVLGLLALALTTSPAGAEQNVVRIGLGRPFGHLPLLVMDEYKLVEKHAAALGLPNIKVDYSTHATGQFGNDALLAGTVDFLSVGVTSGIILWAKTKGTSLEVKGVASEAALPTVLNTRNPAVHSIRDLTDKDKIGLSAVKVSYNAMLLQMAAAKEWGQANYDKLDRFTVTRSAPDAMASLLSPAGDVDCDFGVPPYVQMELRNPMVHSVFSSYDLLGAPPTFSIVLATRKFHDQNPTLYKAFLDAMGEAMDIIRTDEPRTVQAYLEQGDKFPVEVVQKALHDPQTQFSLEPHSMMAYAQFMKQAGMLSRVPNSWKDMFFPEIYNLQGN